MQSLFCRSTIVLLGWIVFSQSLAHAALVQYVIDPNESILTVEAVVTEGQILAVPQSPGSEIAQLSGTLSADLIGSTLHFNGTSVITALENPAGPFLPPNVAMLIENIGLQDEFGGGLFSAAVRGAAVTLSSGKASFGGPLAEMEVAFIAGRLDFKRIGSTELYYLDMQEDLLPQFNTSSGVLERTLVGQVETIVFPFEFTHHFSALLPDDSTIIVSGQMVASRTLSTAQPGDFNADGNVDGADFVIWQTNFPNGSGQATLAMGDANGDGHVDGADFVIWQTNFPFSAAPGGLPAPEPAAFFSALVAMVGCCWLTRRRRM